MLPRDRFLLAAAALSLVLAGCDRGGNTAGREISPGSSGRGADTAQGQPAPSGSGLQGGLGTNAMGAASSPAGSPGVSSGSKNRTTGGSVGNR